MEVEVEGRNRENWRSCVKRPRQARQTTLTTRRTDFKDQGSFLGGVDKVLEAEYREEIG